jgi:threonine aldolase
LVQRSCAAAVELADRLRDAGLTVLNDVVLNQVLVRAGDGASTEALLAAVQRDGRVWCGPTVWDGATAIRVSVSSWKTSSEDARRAAAVIAECAATVGPAR